MAFGKLQAMIPESERKTQQLAEGINYMEFVARLYRNQFDAGRVFLHEQPSNP